MGAKEKTGGSEGNTRGVDNLVGKEFSLGKNILCQPSDFT